MHKAFRDIVERLEEETYDMEICEEQFDMNYPYFKDVPYKMVKMDDVKEIVNQVAEEYKHVTTCYLQSPCEYQNEDIRIDENDGWIPCEIELPPRPEIVDEPKAYLVTVKRNDGFIFWDKLFYHHFGWNIPSTCKIIAWKEVQPYVKEK